MLQKQQHLSARAFLLLSMCYGRGCQVLLRPLSLSKLTSTRQPAASLQTTCQQGRQLAVPIKLGSQILPCATSAPQPPLIPQEGVAYKLSPGSGVSNFIKCEIGAAPKRRQKITTWQPLRASSARAPLPSPDADFPAGYKNLIILKTLTSKICFTSQ